ncbi:MAG: gamma-glutamylcyclotransferase [Rubrivivax sp.]|nr:gamma-glutamylcyclotransferase [Rubrivivax sp.]
MKPEAFVHLPDLRDCIVPPEQSALRVTPAVMAMWDERARLLGRPADWRLGDAEVEASRRATLGARDPAQDLWLYAYGSLMWDPAVQFEEVRRARLPGHQRRFTFRTHIGRGSPACPGLMLSIEARPGDCEGLVFRIAAEHVELESAILWRREMLRGAYTPRLLPLATPQGEVTALVFVSNPEHPDHVGELPLDETARTIARAEGVMGRNRDYVEQLARQLAGLSIVDPYIDGLAAELQRQDAG